MSKIEFEHELAKFIEAALSALEQKIGEKHERASAGLETDDSHWTKKPRHLEARRRYKEALIAGVRWSIWVQQEQA